MQDMRALVVDDSKVGRLTMMKKLEAIGVKVDLAESGQHALDYLAQHRPDMIFMDHMMPEMDGFEVTRRIKASPVTRDIPVIVVSGNDEATFVQEARAAGAIDAITKPPATGVLENLLASLRKLSAQAPAAVVAPVVAEAPQPAVIKPAASIDMASVHALVERVVGAAVMPLHDDFMAEIGHHLEAESGNQRKKLVEWGERLNQQSATMEELRRGMADAETLGNRLQALEQRFLPLEAEAARPQPDFDALRADIEQRFTARLAESDARTDARIDARTDARIDGLTPELESLRRGLHDVQARLDQHAAQAEQKSSEWRSEWGRRLDTLAADLAHVSQDVQSIRSTQAGYEQRIEQRIDQSIAQLRETLSAAEQVAAAVPEGVSEGGVSVASADIQAMPAELDELRDRLSESRLQQLVAETVSNLQPAVDTQRVVAEAFVPPSVPTSASENLQAELVQLRNKVKTLTVATAVGGALLLAAIGIAVFGG